MKNLLSLILLLLGVAHVRAQKWFVHSLSAKPASDLSSSQFMIDIQQPINVVRFAPNVAQKVSSFCDLKPCQNGGTCSATSHSYQCSCPWGFSGFNCDIIHTDCASSPCTGNKKCRAFLNGGFECVCPAGTSGANCQVQNDLCSSSPCLNNGVCQPLDGDSIRCECMHPWSGDRCEKLFQNPCSEEVLRQPEVVQFQNPWDHQSYLICINVNRYQSMPCPVGTEFHVELRHCTPIGYVEKSLSSCPPNYCHNNGLCTTDSQGLLKCECAKGFIGARCQINVDECVLGGHAACNPSGRCIDQVNGYYCECPNGMIGLNCHETISNPCTLENLQNDRVYFSLPTPRVSSYIHCAGELRFSVNKCAEGLFWHQEQQTCTIDPPTVAKSSPCSSSCMNGGQCDINGVCICPTGSRGPTCEIRADFCESSPCKNGGVCISHPTGYDCICPNKIVDDCCCHGVANPCPNKQSNDVSSSFFPHLLSSRYIQCDHNGRAFVKSCPDLSRWDQSLLVCLPMNAVVSKKVTISPLSWSHRLRSYASLGSSVHVLKNKA